MLSFESMLRLPSQEEWFNTLQRFLIVLLEIRVRRSRIVSLATIVGAIAADLRYEP